MNQPTNELSKVSAGTLSLSRDQIDLIKRTVCRESTDDELNLFLYTAQRTGLDPLAGQIHAISRWDSQMGRKVMKIQTGIDGFRVVAQRSGEYEGQTSPQWCGEDGVWRDVWTEKRPPFAARVGVWRKGFREPLYGLAQWSFYVQTKKDGSPSSMWERGGPHMLAKCAEGLALRKAFPNDLSGLYTPDEMGQAEDAEPADKSPKQVKNRAATESAAQGEPPLIRLTANGTAECAIILSEKAAESAPGVVPAWKLYRVIIENVAGRRAELTTGDLAVADAALLAKTHNKRANCTWTVDDTGPATLTKCEPVGVPAPAAAEVTGKGKGKTAKAPAPEPVDDPDLSPITEQDVEDAMG